MADESGVRFRSRVFSYGHFVWATRYRAPVLTPEWERAVYRVVTVEVERLGCAVLAMGGMPDHVHLVVRLGASVSVAQVAKQVKGVSSRLLNSLRPEFSEPFHWQDGYGFLSVGQSAEELEAVLGYVRDQKRHHGGMRFGRSGRRSGRGFDGLVLRGRVGVGRYRAG